MQAVPTPVNELILGYEPGTPAREKIQDELKRQLAAPVEIPAIVGGERIHGDSVQDLYCPHDHSKLIAKVHQVDTKVVEKAITVAVKAQREWAEMPWEARAAVFLKAADLLAGKYRAVLNAATMLGQSKTVYQAEIDAACELIDFFRFNTYFAAQMAESQPISPSGQWNRTELRGLEGFVFAATPFNFSSIAINLAAAPALMGCSALWKPAPTAALSGYWGMMLLEEAGLPPGVINFVPGDATMLGDFILGSPHLAGIHFTGSTATFNSIWAKIGQNIPRYRSYPRIVGETGGKDFVFAHASADLEPLAVALVRGAFEYQGQKCSAASRAFIPRSLWPKLKDMLVGMTRELTMGDPTDFRNFMAAVIDKRAFDKIRGYIEHARTAPDAKILTGGGCRDAVGYFIEPTIIETTNPNYRGMVEEIFGPVLSVFVYEDAALDDAVRLCDSASAYALTGAIFARDRRVIADLSARLRYAAGNFYINDKPTGAVVGQQPFGGGRASGTNDKAGSYLNLTRWVSMRTIKENFVPPTSVNYPHMA